MNLIQKFGQYINPIAHLGERKYSYTFPLVLSIFSYVAIEIYIHMIVHNTASLAALAITIPIALTVYFSSRDGILGGLIPANTAVGYYFYIIIALHYTGQQYVSGVTTTIILGIIYTILAFVIGWLKQSLDAIIEKEKKARYTAEEGKLRLQTILAQLPVGVLILDGKMKKFDANKQTEKILGKKIKGSIMRSANYVSPFAYYNQHPLSPKEWPITRAITHGETVFEEEIEYVRDDGKRIFLLVNAAPIKNIGGETVAAVSTLYDITQLKELDAKKDDFINMASHELKTPITSLKLYLDSLVVAARNQHNPTIKKLAGNIELQTKRLQKLSKDLLDVSLMQTGQFTLSRKKIRIDQLISRVIDVLQRTTPQKILFSQKAPLVAKIDPFRIEQVLTNIINNAIKYSQKKDDIVISLRENNGRAIISIKDDGIGIAKDQQKNIFNKLYRVRENMGNTFPGFGMGLYIAKEIVKTHEGDVWVGSRKGKGSTFYISLPIDV